jgi:hypothetical protein
MYLRYQCTSYMSIKESLFDAEDARHCTSLIFAIAYPLWDLATTGFSAHTNTVEQPRRGPFKVVFPSTTHMYCYQSAGTQAAVR